MHYPVMLQNVLKLIGNMKVHRNISIVDCNFGLGGHSNAILQAFPNAYMYHNYNF
jgi:16S rRNA C1402 N4-methylase RsmH